MRYLLFDLDGTLLNTQEGILCGVRHVLQQQGLSQLAREVTAQQLIGPSLRDSFSRLLQTEQPARINSAINRFRHYYLSKGIYQYQHYPHIKAALQQLNQRGYGLLVATSKPQMQAEILLRHSHLAPYFQAIYGSDDQTPGHSKALTLKKILDQHQIAAHHCSMIGDHRLDIDAGKQQGMNTVAVSWGYDPLDQLQRTDSDELIHTPQALLRLFPVTETSWQANLAI
ncbi:HAD family hydrolase [Marinobacterium jannaschii]|uniref:HAD family hydrolase n=1 Tax=Marinobacterium jannaschii TaxID=64970 RepID=UPI000481A0DA|nr:HAD hydrolase-like protein [Marinobacterium jannaschii]